MGWTVGLESYRVMATHGYYDHELEREQPYVISLWVDITGAVPTEGEISATVDYALLQTIIDEEIIDGPPAKLMEEMCHRLIERLQPISQVTSVRVRIEKPEAPLPHEGGVPVVEMQWDC